MNIFNMTEKIYYFSKAFNYITINSHDQLDKAEIVPLKKVPGVNSYKRYQRLEATLLQPDFFTERVKSYQECSPEQ